MSNPQVKNTNYITHKSYDKHLTLNSVKDKILLYSKLWC